MDLGLETSRLSCTILAQDQVTHLTRSFKQLQFGRPVGQRKAEALNVGMAATQ